MIIYWSLYPWNCQEIKREDATFQDWVLSPVAWGRIPRQVRGGFCAVTDFSKGEAWLCTGWAALSSPSGWDEAKERPWKRTGPGGRLWSVFLQGRTGRIQGSGQLAPVSYMEDVQRTSMECVPEPCPALHSGVNLTPHHSRDVTGGASSLPPWPLAWLLWEKCVQFSLKLRRQTCTFGLEEITVGKLDYRKM